MAKRKTQSRPLKPSLEPEAESGAVAFQVRFDADLHARLKAEADAADISLNQLVQGICRGALDFLHQGEAEMLSTGFVKARQQKRCVYFGRPGWSCSAEEAERIRDATGDEPAEPDKGALWFSLDFTNRGVVRHQPR